MSNQAKLLISVLFIAMILLCIGLTRVYFNVSKNTDNINDEERIAEIQKTYSNGMQSFISSNGLYGILDSERNIVIEPEWMEILDVTDHTILVSRRMHGDVLIGGIDYEENVTLPFVFRSMEKVGGSYYIGTVAEDESCIIYNADFTTVFPESWMSARYDNGMLLLEQDECIFSYYIGEDVQTPMFRRSQMSCEIAGRPLEWNVANQTYLSELSSEDMLRINSIVPSYIDMLISNDFISLSDITSEEFIAGLSKMNCFPGFVFEEVRDFSFSTEDREGVRDYDFAFTLQYHTDGTAVDSETAETQPSSEITPALLEQSVQIHLYFHRNTDNQLILTSANLDFHSKEIPVTEASAAGAE